MIVTRATTVYVQKKPASVHEVTDTTSLDAQVAQIHQIMKNMITSSNTPVVEPIKVVIDVNYVACVYCMGALLFEYWLVNHVFVNYVGNNKYNNPYSNTYNPRWHDHLNFS